MLYVKKYFCKTNRGFTFIEVAIVLIIAGIIISVGAASWLTFMEGRRVAKTRSVLQQAKDCLVRRVVFNERYPREEDFTDCLDEAGSDGWGRQVYGLVGHPDGDDDPLDGTDFVVSDDARDQTMTTVSADYVVTTVQGNQTKIAFVLFSRGKDGKADDTSYDEDEISYDEDDHTATLPKSGADFSSTTDDLYLVVKSYELIAAIKNAVGH